ncbi:MAG: nucleotidyltransferase family protein [Burkholderiales bacterium]|nr:nucleotidyltransferase family protein [Burkholderiales bacterium]
MLVADLFSTDSLSADFLATVLQNPYNAQILQRLPDLQAPQAHLAAGCLFQTVWNSQCQRPLTENILDYDVFYFDASDLSWEAEDSVIQRAASLFADLPVKVEVRNQARVHLWYEQKFGYAYSPLTSCREGVDRFLIASSCVAISVQANGEYDVYSTHGLQALYDGQLRANPNLASNTMFLAKAQSYQQRWPHLRIVA